MTRFTTLAAVALGSAALLVSVPASAQGARDLDPVAVASATRYALPHAFEGYLDRCTSRLDPNGFALSNSERLRDKFADGSEAGWPGAKALLIGLATQEDDGASDMIAMLDDGSLRPFVDGLLTNLVAQEIKPETCPQIERALEILDPLPADNLAQFTGFIMEMVQDDEERKASGPMKDRSDAGQGTRR
ncbi:hypothetical protein [Qipengyuania nanhaisediminis]|uniref:hypothetical protein n=1 Tax=Qipengyuania nanhaisediminis TaxID=604088 RepID=UPI0038B2A3D3